MTRSTKRSAAHRLSAGDVIGYQSHFHNYFSAGFDTNNTQHSSLSACSHWPHGLDELMRKKCHYTQCPVHSHGSQRSLLIYRYATWFVSGRAKGKRIDHHHHQIMHEYHQNITCCKKMVLGGDAICYWLISIFSRWLPW